MNQQNTISITSVKKISLTHNKWILTEGYEVEKTSVVIDIDYN